MYNTEKMIKIGLLQSFIFKYNQVKWIIKQTDASDGGIK
jgi:hypothetical protein